MKKYKKTITVIIILAVAVLMFAGFFGINKKNEKGEKVNLIPNLKLGMEFGNTRVITATISDEIVKTIYDAEGNVVEPEEGKEYKEEDGYKTVEQPVNPDSVKKLGNYKKAKKIIEKRLQGNKISEYFVTLDELTGKIKIEIPEDSNAGKVQDIIKNSGTFMLLDGETFETVFDSRYLKKADVMYSQGDVETGVFLQLTFNEEGKAKLQELNKKYVETTEEKTNEEGETETVKNSKVVWVFLNDSFLGTTVMPNISYDDKIVLTFGVSNDNKELQKAIENAEEEAILLNSGTNSVVYEYSNETKSTNITAKEMYLYIAVIGAIFLIANIYLIIKFKAKGFISAYFQIGYLGVLLLILRATNVIINYEAISAIVISMLVEYMFTYIILRNIVKQTDGFYSKANLEFFLNSLPIYVIAIMFSFATRANINSFGMTLFWGIIVTYIYNFIFSKYIFENLKLGGSK